MISGNKGEWSELYVLLYLLGVGKLYAANDDLETIKDLYYPILQIMRKDLVGEIDYHIIDEKLVEIKINDYLLRTIPAEEFKKEADSLYASIIKGTNRAFTINNTEAFMNRILAYRLAAPSTDKTDITMKVHDPKTGMEPVLGFSIKSELGGAPTLLNASGATNLCYEIKGLEIGEENIINEIETRTKILDRIKKVHELGGEIIFSHCSSQEFSNNMMLIDSRMEEIIAYMMLKSYETGESNIVTLVKKYLERENPLSYPDVNFYEYKIKKFLASVALGMKPSAPWNGIDEANGGYIVVTHSGKVVAYHLYNRNYFEKYLYQNTRLERASTSRHNYAHAYNRNGKIYIDLNLQIRFI